VSYEGARENLKAEIKDFNFEKTRNETKQVWNKELSVIDIKGTIVRSHYGIHTGLLIRYIPSSNPSVLPGLSIL